MDSGLQTLRELFGAWFLASSNVKFLFRDVPKCMSFEIGRIVFNLVENGWRGTFEDTRLVEA